MAADQIDRRAHAVLAIAAQQKEDPGYCAEIAERIVTAELAELEREMKKEKSKR